MTADMDGASGDRRAVSRETSPPAAAAHAFGRRLDVAVAYVELLAGPGIERGLVGPREAPRLWERHVLNSAVVAELIRPGSTVADVGSGAGLPGIPIAIARPDLTVTLIEPLLRRSEFLREAVERLRLDNVTVVRSRAEDVVPTEPFDVVVARAVAPMKRLAGWCLPLVRPHGLLLALKGESVVDELSSAGASLATMGATSWRVEAVGRGLIDPATLVAVVEQGDRRPAVTTRPRQKKAT